MLTTSYETQTICDNCGRIVTRRPSGPAAFERRVEVADPALPEVAPDGVAVMDDGDLVSEDSGGQLEVLVEHVAVCDRCSATP